MATVTLHNTPVQTSGELPDIGSEVPGFRLVDIALKDVALEYAFVLKVFNMAPR